MALGRHVLGFLVIWWKLHLTRVPSGLLVKALLPQVVGEIFEEGVVVIESLLPLLTALANVSSRKKSVGGSECAHVEVLELRTDAVVAEHVLVKEVRRES